MIKKVTAAFFSPVGSTGQLTELIARTAAEALGAEYAALDFTLPEARRAGTKHAFTREDLLVFGMPTYAGRLPNKISPFVSSAFSGDETPAVAVVTYGNRSFGSSLAEMKYLLQQNDFGIVSEAAFPCAHVFSDKLAPGRPDDDDLAAAAEFARSSAEAALSRRSPLPAVAESEIAPYYRPLTEDGTPADFLKAKPWTDPDICNGGGKCSRVCPMGAIAFPDVSKVTGVCIKCFACVRLCPRGAKHFVDPDLLSHIRMLERDHAERKEIYMFP